MKTKTTFTAGSRHIAKISDELTIVRINGIGHYGQQLQPWNEATKKLVSWKKVIFVREATASDTVDNIVATPVVSDDRLTALERKVEILSQQNHDLFRALDRAGISAYELPELDTLKVETESHDDECDAIEEQFDADDIDAFEDEFEDDDLSNFDEETEVISTEAKYEDDEIVELAGITDKWVNDNSWSYTAGTNLFNVDWQKVGAVAMIIIAVVSSLFVTGSAIASKVQRTVQETGENGGDMVHADTYSVEMPNCVYRRMVKHILQHNPDLEISPSDDISELYWDASGKLQ